MISPSLTIMLYFIILIRIYATPQDDEESEENIRIRRLIIALLIILILSCIPWLVAHMAESKVIWPELLHGVVFITICLFCLFLIRRKK